MDILLIWLKKNKEDMTMDENNNMEGMDGMEEDVIVFEDEDG